VETGAVGGAGNVYIPRGEEDEEVVKAWETPMSFKLTISGIALQRFRLMDCFHCVGLEFPSEVFTFCISWR
jgi:hypothetical protein